VVAENDTEVADRLGRKRSRVTIAIAIYFIAGQAMYLGQPAHDPLRLVDQVRISAWLVWAVVLMVLLATNGPWIRSKSVRALMNDEVTRANRAEAFMWGFWGAMLVAAALYFTSLFEPLSGREAIRAVVTIGLGAALLRFGILERRALKDG
jgi:magnesium-transporting ATPase (P-type)